MHQSEQSRSIPQLIKNRERPILKSRGDNLFYGFADEKEGNVIALKFVTALGEQKAIHYHDILSPMDYNGDSEIRLATTRLNITIKGKNLNNLFDHIIQHRVMWIQEPQHSFLQAEEGGVEVTEIWFEMVQ